jgi:thioredoxin 2
MSATVGSESVHATCPGCGKTIRIPAGRLQDAPRCPACRHGIFTGSPIALDDRSFDAFLCGNDLPVLVDFWAPWCAPCRAFAPVVEQAAQLLSSHAIIAKVNSDEAPTVSQRHQIRSIPTIALFKNGREVARKTGTLPLSELMRWLATMGIDRPSER